MILLNDNRKNGSKSENLNSDLIITKIKEKLTNRKEVKSLPEAKVTHIFRTIEIFSNNTISNTGFRPRVYQQ